MVEEYLAKQESSTTASPAIDMRDDSRLAIDNSVTNESSDVSLDQSNNGFSFVNTLGIIQHGSFFRSRRRPGGHVHRGMLLLPRASAASILTDWLTNEKDNMLRKEK